MMGVAEQESNHGLGMIWMKNDHTLNNVNIANCHIVFAADEALL